MKSERRSDGRCEHDDDYVQVLSTEGLRSGYGSKIVVNDVSIRVMAGEVVALIGPNGAGKSTLLKTVFGLVQSSDGTISVLRNRLHPCSPIQMVKAGVSYVPQGSRVFLDMTVVENLEVGGFACLDKCQVQPEIEKVWRLFPALSERAQQLACKLSGGERQMLALGQALMTRPRLLLLDEPSLGLAPQTAGAALAAIRILNAELGTAVLLVEQNVREALAVADRVYVLRQGEIVLEAHARDVTMDALRLAFLG